MKANPDSVSSPFEDFLCRPPGSLHEGDVPSPPHEGHPVPLRLLGPFLLNLSSPDPPAALLRPK